MKKSFLLFGIALMMLFPISAWAAEDDDPLGNALLADEKSPSYRLPEYWLGIQFRPAFPALLAQLHLPQNQGVVVEAVVPDSPAAKAGLLQYDVILKADDKKVSDISDLLQAVEAAKDKEMKLEIIRDGQGKTIAVTPAKRPEQALLPVPPPESDFEALRKWIEQLQPGAGFGRQGPMQFRLIRPGVILPRGAPLHPPLPGNMSISITKTGDKPADIVVKLDEEKWEVTEKDLDKLPDKVRPFVDRMLGLATGIGPGAMRWAPEVFTPSPQPEPGTPPGPNPSGDPRVGQPPFGPGPNLNLPPLEDRIEKRLEEMKRHIEKLENELHERHQDLKTPQPGPAPEKNKEPAPEKAAL
ncbi:MAG: PDZ domain-containing protein [Thermoguttaceae bacterium]|jgi:membrane-associated protease RseP (regulator of RpoE activity)